MLAGRSLDIADIELEPTLEELDVPVDAVQRRPSRAVAIAVALFGAIVGWGFVGADDPATTGPASLPAVSAPGPSGAPQAGPVVTTPIAGEALVDTPVRVAGSADVPGNRVRVTVALGELVLGQADVAVEGAFFAADVPVIAPLHGGALPVDIRIAASGAPGAVLATVRVRLAPRPQVSIDAVARASRNDIPVIAVQGSAALEAGRLSVTIVHRYGRATTEVVVGPVRAPRTADVARLFGVGTWVATFAVAHDVGAVRAIVRWDDGTAAGGTAAFDEARP